MHRFKVSNISTRIFEAKTGVKTEYKTIRYNNKPRNVKLAPEHELKNYYKSISIADKIVTSTNLLTETKIESHYTSENKKRLFCDLDKDILTENEQGKTINPSTHEILKKSKFGKISRHHSFTSGASFEHILVFILKKKFLKHYDLKNLLKVHPLYNHLNKMISWTKNIDFSDLKNPIQDYANQKSISSTRVKKLLAATLHYDLNIPTVIRYLGGNYTGEYRDVKKTIKILKKSKCDETIISDLKRTLELGCPNKFNAHSPHNNFLDFFRYGNHSSINKNLEQTLKAMNKEDRNQYLIPLPNWLARFLPNLHITPQGLLVKKDKNDRLIWDGSFLPHWAALCINMMLTHDTEPEIIYGTAFMWHLKRIFNKRIRFPKKDLVLMDDDAKGAFRHCKYHPDVAAAFAFIISYYLYIPTGGTFGSIVSPSNFEPIARARTHLATYLSDKEDFTNKYNHILNKVVFSDEPPKDTTFIRAVPDKFNVGIKNIRQTEYNMFVDDSLFVQTRDGMKQAMAASIEALYIILGYPEEEKRQNALSLDKYFESVCSHERIQLGIKINTRKMTIGLSDSRRSNMLHELAHWHKKRKSFTLLQGVTLCGILEFWANTSPWIRFIYTHLRSSVNKCLHSCNEINNNKKSVKKLISEVAYKKESENHELMERYVQSKIAKEMYKCKHKAFINKDMKQDLKLLTEILKEPDKYWLETPIAHVIEREPDFITYGDACLYAAGGFSENKFWWHIEWPSEIISLTIKHLMVSRKCRDSNKLISINLLEFAVEIINYAAVTVMFSNNKSLCEHEYPLLLNWTDNMSSKSWIKKVASKTKKGKALQRILCSIMINNQLGIETDHIPGENNILADTISRIYSSSSSVHTFDILFEKFPQIKQWKRFQPSQELLSVIYLALLKEQDPGLCPPKNLGHFILDKDIL